MNKQIKEQLMLLIKRGSYNYHGALIPKKSSDKMRKIQVFSPITTAEEIPYKNLAWKLNQIGVDKNAVGYRKGVSTAMIQKRHQRHNWFYKYDFKDFFQSFDLPVVYERFKNTFTLEEISLMCWMATRNTKPRVEQGNPLSPQITNIMMETFDKSFLASLKHKFNCDIQYSRYADDILVSSFVKLDPKKVTNILKKSLVRTGLKFLKLNNQKTRFMKKGGKIIFLGISINSQATGGAGAKHRKAVLSVIRQLQKLNPGEEVEAKPRQLDKIQWAYHQAIYINSISKNKIDLGIFDLVNWKWYTWTNDVRTGTLKQRLTNPQEYRTGRNARSYLQLERI